jgi:type III pantothenate kinase
MLLAVDIGNSAIKFGLFEQETLASKFSIPTIRTATSDDLMHVVATRLDFPIDAAIVCSVVPEVDSALREFLRSNTGVEPIFVNNSFDFGLKINYEPLDSLGTDRLVAAFAAVEMYGAPVIVCSLGTATTIDVVSADREFLGGVIAPGMNAMAEALHLKASKLPKVDAAKPESVIGNSTVDAIRSGVFYGYVAMVEGLIERFKKVVGSGARVIATGGSAEFIADKSEAFEIVELNLIMSGLQALTRRR